VIRVAVQMSVNRKYDRGLIVLIVLVILAFAALQPRFTLRPDMPAEFADLQSIPPKKRPAEEKIARAYWNCAVTQIQWSYGYGRRLPDDAPPEFAVQADELASQANDPATRDRYWLGLQRVWYLPSTWNKTYGWDATAMKRSLQAAGQWMESQARKITGL